MMTALHIVGLLACFSVALGNALRPSGLGHKRAVPTDTLDNSLNGSGNDLDTGLTSDPDIGREPGTHREASVLLAWTEVCPNGLVPHRNGELCCIPAYCTKDHSIEACTAEGESDQCRPCPAGTVQTNNVTSFNMEEATCYAENEYGRRHCPLDDTKMSRRNWTYSCMLRCECKNEDCFFGDDPCMCNLAWETCGVNQKMNRTTGVCEPCDWHSYKPYVGCGPCILNVTLYRFGRQRQKPVTYTSTSPVTRTNTTQAAVVSTSKTKTAKREPDAKSLVPKEGSVPTGIIVIIVVVVILVIGIIVALVGVVLRKHCCPKKDSSYSPVVNPQSLSTTLVANPVLPAGPQVPVHGGNLQFPNTPEANPVLYAEDADRNMDAVMGSRVEQQNSLCNGHTSGNSVPDDQQYIDQLDNVTSGDGHLDNDERSSLLPVLQFSTIPSQAKHDDNSTCVQIRNGTSHNDCSAQHANVHDSNCRKSVETRPKSRVSIHGNQFENCKFYFNQNEKKGAVFFTGSEFSGTVSLDSERHCTDSSVSNPAGANDLNGLTEVEYNIETDGKVDNYCRSEQTTSKAIATENSGVMIKQPLSDPDNNRVVSGAGVETVKHYNRQSSNDNQAENDEGSSESSTKGTDGQKGLKGMFDKTITKSCDDSMQTFSKSTKESSHETDVLQSGVSRCVTDTQSREVASTNQSTPVAGSRPVLQFGKAAAEGSQSANSSSPDAKSKPVCCVSPMPREVNRPPDFTVRSEFQNLDGSNSYAFLHANTDSVPSDIANINDVASSGISDSGFNGRSLNSPDSSGSTSTVPSCSRTGPDGSSFNDDTQPSSDVCLTEKKSVFSTHETDLKSVIPSDFEVLTDGRLSDSNDQDKNKTCADFVPVRVYNDEKQSKKTKVFDKLNSDAVEVRQSDDKIDPEGTSNDAVELKDSIEKKQKLDSKINVEDAIEIKPQSNNTINLEEAAVNCHDNQTICRERNASVSAGDGHDIINDLEECNDTEHDGVGMEEEGRGMDDVDGDMDNKNSCKDKDSFI